MNTFTKIGIVILMVGSCLAGHASKRAFDDVPKNGHSAANIAIWKSNTTETATAAIYDSWSHFGLTNFTSYLLKPFASKKFVHYTATTAANTQLLGVGPVQNGISPDNGKPKMLPTLSAFPNPSKGRFTISLTQTAGDIYKIKISNTIGKVIQTITLGDHTNVADISIDLSDKPAGVYFYSLLINDKMVETKRLILQQ
ncbi:T9SS type A sorting domain-containing protein [Adhaeribacter swui]|uniref:T9SS type A sorting domain-containing protein n=1 Tax=Adhaeribacter swui TaxID=2086471 RepID=A0A7G7G569_9BACT|nr:T9SS type A sorting domain-containing protein [Adhaeribacter swui]QNF32303.1 T9SS type A sorting domain-containing protein [Adhaeribacter swui]